MPKVSVSRRLSDPPEEVWRTVGDAYSMSRWWPRVSRVENVGMGGFTQVLQTNKGRGIRADFSWAHEPDGQRMAWTQDLDGSPFQRLFARSETTVTVEPDGTGSKVTLMADQELKGWSRFSPWLVKGAPKKVLVVALDGLATLHDR